MTQLETESARSLLEKVLDTQRQIKESFLVKPGDDVYYYGWYSEDIQRSRILNQTEHKFIKGNNENTTNKNTNKCSRIIKSPPYTYWLRGDKNVLVTDVTNSDEMMQRHKETHSIFLGKIDKFHCRSFTKL